MQDADYMQLALQLANRRLGRCAPNPAVGAVLVRGHEVIATGYHWGVGYAHAEVQALESVSLSQAKGSTLYVTLEPCCIWSHTPPCTQAIIDKQIARVVYGFIDPNPSIQGQGIAQLTAAGIDCELCELSTVSFFYRAYHYWRTTSLPEVTVKFAATLAGHFAKQGDQPLAITSKRLAVLTHQLRCQHDAILTTAETIIADNPRLDTRLVHETIAKPLYLLDSQLRLPLDAKVLRTASKITVFHGRAATKERRLRLEEQGVQCIMVSEDAWGLSWQAVLELIGEQGHYSLWVEAGERCLRSLLASGYLARGLFYLAPQSEEDTSQLRESEVINSAWRVAKKVHWHTIDDELIADCSYDVLMS